MPILVLANYFSISHFFRFGGREEKAADDNFDDLLVASPLNTLLSLPFALAHVLQLRRGREREIQRQREREKE